MWFPEVLEMPVIQRKEPQDLIDEQGRWWRQRQKGINKTLDKGSSNQDMTGPHKALAPHPNQDAAPIKPMKGSTKEDAAKTREQTNGQHNGPGPTRWTKRQHNTEKTRQNDGNRRTSANNQYNRQRNTTEPEPKPKETAHTEACLHNETNASTEEQTARENSWEQPNHSMDLDNGASPDHSMETLDSDANSSIYNGTSSESTYAPSTGMKPREGAALSAPTNKGEASTGPLSRAHRASKDHNSAISGRSAWDAPNPSAGNAYTAKTCRNMVAIAN